MRLFLNAEGFSSFLGNSLSRGLSNRAAAQRPGTRLSPQPHPILVPIRGSCLSVLGTSFHTAGPLGS